MGKVRALVNAELIAVSPNGVESTVQFGAGTYFESNHILTYTEGKDGDTLADITLKDGSVIEGVVWNTHTFENHGVVQETIVKNEPKIEALKAKGKETNEPAKLAPVSPNVTALSPPAVNVGAPVPNGGPAGNP